MSTPEAGQQVRVCWVILGAAVWLIVASSITLEQGQETIALWGSAATLLIIGLLALLAAGRAAWISLRGIGRRVRRWAAGRLR